MAVNEALYRRLLHGGVGHEAARLLADPAQDNVSGAAVADPAALTAPATFAATYTATESSALRADVAALRSTVVALQAELRNAGVIAP